MIVSITLPDGLAQRLERTAAASGLSLSAWVEQAAIASFEREAAALRFFEERAAGADRTALQAALRRAGGEPPRAGDEIDPPT